MSYAEMLEKIIAESELSLRQIARHCEDQNLHITPSYISQLKNGKLAPPTEEVSLVLAKVCGAKQPANLVFQGYMEKAPALVREYMLASSTLNRAIIEALCKLQEGYVTEEVKNYIKEMDVLSALELSSKYAGPEADLRDGSLVREIALATGEITEADTKGELLNFFLGDNSMSPTIPNHSFINVLPTRLDLLKERDVVAIYPDNRKTPTLRRLFLVKDKVILIPEDKGYQTYFFESLEEMDYIGKVVSYRVDI